MLPRIVPWCSAVVLAATSGAAAAARPTRAGPGGRGAGVAIVAPVVSESVPWSSRARRLASSTTIARRPVTSALAPRSTSIPPLRALPAAALRRGGDRPDPSLDPSFTPKATEQSRLRLAQDDEFGVVFGDAEKIQHCLFRLGE